MQERLPVNGDLSALEMLFFDQERTERKLLGICSDRIIEASFLRDLAEVSLLNLCVWTPLFVLIYSQLHCTASELILWIFYDILKGDFVCNHACGSLQQQGRESVVVTLF